MGGSSRTQGQQNGSMEEKEEEEAEDCQFGAQSGAAGRPAEPSGAQPGAPDLLSSSPWAAGPPAGLRRTTLPKARPVSVRLAGLPAEPSGAQPDAAGLTAESSACELIWV
jgi:hypothetical protein